MHRKLLKSCPLQPANNMVTQGDEIVQGTFRTASFVREYFPGKEQIYEDELYSCSLVEAPEYGDHPRRWLLRDTLPTNA